MLNKWKQLLNNYWFIQAKLYCNILKNRYFDTELKRTLNELWTTIERQRNDMSFDWKNEERPIVSINNMSFLCRCIGRNGPKLFERITHFFMSFINSWTLFTDNFKTIYDGYVYGYMYGWVYGYVYGWVYGYKPTLSHTCSQTFSHTYSHAYSTAIQVYL